MFPLPEKPVVVVLVDEKNGQIVQVASNIDPKIEVHVTTAQRLFDNMSLGKPFNGPLAPRPIL